MTLHPYLVTIYSKADDSVLEERTIHARSLTHAETHLLGEFGLRDDLPEEGYYARGELVEPSEPLDNPRLGLSRMW